MASNLWKFQDQITLETPEAGVYKIPHVTFGLSEDRFILFTKSGRSMVMMAIPESYEDLQLSKSLGDIMKSLDH